MTCKPDKPLRPVVAPYFEAHPEARDSVRKAFYAYHVPHFMWGPKAHNFPDASRESQCVWCGRSREAVRHDSLPAECQKRPEPMDIEGVVRQEEEKVFALIKKAQHEVPKLVAKMGMSEETLKTLYQTYGYDAETVAAVMAEL